MVSPKIVQELLKAEKLSLGGARREVTVLFADVRGFTEFTDRAQQEASRRVAERRLSDAAAEACFDEEARETLDTVNLYLGILANTVIKHDGTLDKFIGDCVMAFWGAPAPNPRHAVACVEAAIEAQRALFELNKSRTEENRRREEENRTRVAAGLPPRPLLPILLLGSGINTGTVVVGLMGSEVQDVVRQGSYTVFGREVNLASRLEALSGSGRIFITEGTHRQLQQFAPVLAATCKSLPAVTVKGIREAVAIFEVPWLPHGSPGYEAILQGQPPHHHAAASPEPA
jgi:adenylate cyclase